MIRPSDLPIAGIAGLMRSILLLSIVTALAGCALVDPDQARLCRIAIPALEPPGTRVTLLRVAFAQDGLRIDYRTGEGAAAHFVRCRFDPVRRTDLVAVTTDRGEVAGATVQLLKRFYIESAEGVAADPGPPAPDADLAEWPPALARFAQHLLPALPSIAIDGLLAAAVALVFGVTGRLHLALGPVAALGAAACGIVAAATAASGGGSVAGLGLALAIAVGCAACHGLVVGRLAFTSIPANAVQASLIATVGIALALPEYLRLTGGAAPPWLPPFGGDPLPVARAGPFIVTVTAAEIATALGGLVSLGLALVLIARAPFGRHWRAVRDEPVAAALCGVDRDRVLRLALLLSAALAGLAGALVVFRFGALGFAGGFSLGLKGLTGAFLGGIASVPGASIGGLAVGTFEALWSAAFPTEWRDIALHLALVTAILLRPTGLFDARQS